MISLIRIQCFLDFDAVIDTKPTIIFRQSREQENLHEVTDNSGTNLVKSNFPNIISNVDLIAAINSGKTE